MSFAVKELPTIFTRDPDKLAQEVTPRLAQSFAAAHIMVATYGRAADVLCGAQAAMDKMPSHIDPDMPFSKITRYIAEHHPEMEISGAVINFIAHFGETEKQIEISAACLARWAIQNGRSMRLEDFLSGILPKGYPSPEYMREMEEFYDEFPDLLWASPKEFKN